MYMGFVDVTCHIPNMIHPNVPTLTLAEGFYVLRDLVPTGVPVLWSHHCVADGGTLTSALLASPRNSASSPAGYSLVAPQRGRQRYL